MRKDRLLRFLCRRRPSISSTSLSSCTRTDRRDNQQRGQDIHSKNENVPLLRLTSEPCTTQTTDDWMTEWAESETSSSFLQTTLSLLFTVHTKCTFILIRTEDENEWTRGVIFIAFEMGKRSYSCDVRNVLLQLTIFESFIRVNLSLLDTYKGSHWHSLTNNIYIESTYRTILFMQTDIMSCYKERATTHISIVITKQPLEWRRRNVHNFLFTLPNYTREKKRRHFFIISSDSWTFLANNSA